MDKALKSLLAISFIVIVILSAGLYVVSAKMQLDSQNLETANQQLESLTQQLNSVMSDKSTLQDEANEATSQYNDLLDIFTQHALNHTIIELDDTWTEMEHDLEFPELQITRYDNGTHVAQKIHFDDANFTSPIYLIGTISDVS